MKLKFIGKDGSLGLQHGKTYNVTLKTLGGLVIATIKTGWISDTLCPYGSMKAFAANWELDDKHGER
jgi:hypothetical protein